MTTPFQRLESENLQLRSENERLRAENQAAKEREERYRNELERFKKGIVDRHRRDQERLDRLMLGHRIKFNRSLSRTKSPAIEQVDDHGTRLTIPQEIIDQFIDHLHDDQRALMTCALVCRGWVHSSRYHLFSKLDIMASGQPLDGLVGHLDHPLCTFATSVRKLFIWASMDDGFFDIPSLDARGWLVPLIPYLAKLVSVKYIFGEEIGGEETISGWQALLKSTSFVTQITHLHLDDPGFSSFEQCMETICSFQSLVRLGYSSVNRYDDQWTLSLPVFQGSLPPPLRVLDISSPRSSLQLPWSQLIWQWLHRSQTQLSTVRLGIVSISNQDVAAAKLQSFTRYLQGLGPSLEVLRVGFHNAISISLFLDNVDLTLNTSLRVLELLSPFHFNPEDKSFDDRFSLLPLLLSSIPKAALTTIKFEFWPCSANLHCFDANPNATWTAIDELLAGPSFSVLTELAFRKVEPHRRDFDIMKYIEQRLPRCKQRGLCISNYN